MSSTGQMSQQYLALLQAQAQQRQQQMMAQQLQNPQAQSQFANPQNGPQPNMSAPYGGMAQAGNQVGNALMQQNTQANNAMQAQNTAMPGSQTGQYANTSSQNPTLSPGYLSQAGSWLGNLFGLNSNSGGS